MGRPKSDRTSSPSKGLFRYLKLIISTLLLLTVAVVIVLTAWIIVEEMKTFRLQAHFFSEIAKKFSYRLESDASYAIRFPQVGPYDIRMGYTRIPEWITDMGKKGFVVSEQARWSEDLLKYTDWGAFTIYPEKTQAGVRIFDRLDREISKTIFPQRIFTSFESIPPLTTKMLLFIENRKLLDTSAPYRNPAIEVERLLKALSDAVIHIFDDSHKVPGGSTLATQMEKFRHSSEGKTDSAKEKLRQILSASLRSYRGGKNTQETRKKIVLDYINSIPLSAAPGFGEVSGLGDGLWAWYNLDFDTVNRLLVEAERSDINPEHIDEAGAALKAVLSLFLSQRRPSAYLVQSRSDLKELTNTHLRLLSTQGIISPQIRDAALKAPLNFAKQSTLSYSIESDQRKTANIVRSKLLTDLRVQNTYSLDRIDLTVKSTLDLELQRAITHKLNQLKDSTFVRSEGFIGHHLLETGDPVKVIYSFTLFEHTPDGNALRVQTNTFDGPFNIDEQMKLDLGSSAKLRALVHYLEIIASLHQQFASLSKQELAEHSQKPILDPLSRWAIDYLLRAPDRNLSVMLDAAMQREYSASPYESFFTGGGVHRFVNFKEEDDNKVMTVSHAFRHSVNLVFIRLMRDIVYYQIYKRYGITLRTLEKLEDSEKKRLLSLFADREGLAFLKTFYNKYHGKPPQEAVSLLFMEIHPVPGRLSAAIRYLEPEASIETFASSIGRYLPESKLTEPFLEKMYNQYNPEKFSLADIGYLAHVHPLELWVVKYLQKNPAATLSETIEESADERQAVYNWLFKTKSPNKQYKRIRTIVELEAFKDILEIWKRVGYPFDYLVPSYASSIGSSGDRPGALGELIGIILDDGVRYPIIRTPSLRFAEGTPYETCLTWKRRDGEQVIAPEVAQTMRKALIDVVEEGTGIRLKGKAMLSDGTLVPIGGKTGTGDHRYKRFGTGGILLGSTVMNRAATFVFFMGDNYFGSITAFVPGKIAEDYSFSSSLTTKVLQMLLPELLPLFESQEKNPPGAGKIAAAGDPA